MAYLLLGIGQIIGLAITPLGFPGIWVQIAALALFGWWTGFEAIGTVPLVLLVSVALLAELLEAVVTGGRMGSAQRRRSGWFGLAGGALGAAVGARYPLLGSLFGALAGSFVGSLLGALSLRTDPPGIALRLGGALVTGIKAAAAVVVAVFAIFIIMR